MTSTLAYLSKRVNNFHNEAEVVTLASLKLFSLMYRSMVDFYTVFARYDRWIVADRSAAVAPTTYQSHHMLHGDRMYRISSENQAFVAGFDFDMSFVLFLVLTAL